MVKEKQRWTRVWEPGCCGRGGENPGSVCTGESTRVLAAEPGFGSMGTRVLC